MKTKSIYFLGLLLLMLGACNDGNFDGEVEIPDFNFPQTIVFEDSLSAYSIYEGNPSDLIPSEDFHLIELTSILFTDYAHKQRLVKVPEGTQMTRLSDGSIDFPNGSILVKTFFYYNDERDPNLGKRIIETRLEIKEDDTWNIATYLWNNDQTHATLTLDGHDTQVSWINANGVSLSTNYHVPNENECITCHQTNATMSPLGPTLRNMNRMVERSGESLNQISHLQNVSILNDFQIDQLPSIADYNNTMLSLEERGRAYLAMNCAHCHNPDAWNETAELDFDFRYETPLNQTGILFEREDILEVLEDDEMPFIGTTIQDQEGIGLLIEFIESL